VLAVGQLSKLLVVVVVVVTAVVVAVVEVVVGGVLEVVLNVELVEVEVIDRLELVDEVLVVVMLDDLLDVVLELETEVGFT